MMGVQNIRIALKDARPEDISIVDDVIKYLNFQMNPNTEHATVEIVNSLDKIDAFDLGFDLIKDGVLSCVFWEEKRGDIYYNEEARKYLLEQLILAFAGKRFVDCDYSDMKPIFDKDTEFRVIVCNRDQFVEKAEYLFESVPLEKNIGKRAIFFQLTNPNLDDVMMLFEKYDDIIGESPRQIIDALNYPNQSIIAIFYVK